MSKTIVVVTNIPRPYRRALFEVTASQLLDKGYALAILYTSDPAKHLRRGPSQTQPGSSHSERYVPGLDIRIGYEHILSIPKGLGRLLAECSPECVVSGGFGAATMLSARWCDSVRVPHVLWSGAWPGQEGHIGRLQSAIRRRLVLGAEAFIAYGTAAADYLVELGAPRHRVFCAWNSVDLEGFASAALAAATRRSELADKYRLAGKNLLFVGSLVERKGVQELVSAALAVDLPRLDWALHFVGSGPLEKKLRETVQAAGKAAHFRFQGLRPEHDVAELLGLADGFLLPSRQEAWGLVVNEAMACGVPVVVSPHAGATRDLVVDGVTGYIVEPSATSELTAAISRLLSANSEPRQIGQAGAEAVRAKASLDKSAESFISAVICAISESAHGRL